MIIREWRAWATREGADAYQVHARNAVIPKLSAVPGYLGHVMTELESDEVTEIAVFTFWKDLESIEAFAGSTPGDAVVEPAARDVLLRFDHKVRHHSVWSRDLGPISIGA